MVVKIITDREVFQPPLHFKLRSLSPDSVYSCVGNISLITPRKYLVFPVMRVMTSHLNPMSDPFNPHLFQQVMNAMKNGYGFRLVGDNVDKNVKSRDMRLNSQTTSLHCFHKYAVKDRICFSHLSTNTTEIVQDSFKFEMFYPTVGDKTHQFQAGSPPHQQALLNHLVHTERATHNTGQKIFQLWQVQQEGRVLFYPQVLGPGLWWRALRQGLAMCCISGPMISSEFTPLYEQLSHTTLQPASSHHSMNSKLTPLYDQRAHTTLRPASSHHSMTSELTPFYDQ
ncbi:hypothetical protein EMCRGX_G009506 [Ephydatia muelleri]